MRLYQVISLILITLLIIILRLPTLEEPFDNDSSAVAYSARLITRGESLYSTHHPGHHLPGVYYSYVLAFELFGDSFFAVKLLLIPWTILTAYLVFLLGLHLSNHRVGLFAAIVFSVLSSHVYLKGTTGEQEMFACLPYTAVVLLATRQVQNRAPSWQFVWTGCVGCIAFLYKAVFLAPMVVAAGMIVLAGWVDHSNPNSLRLMVRRLLGLSFGFISVFALVTSYFASQGLLTRFLMVFNTGESYLGLTSQRPVFYVFIIGILILGINNAMVLLLGLLGAQRITRMILLDLRKNRSINIPFVGILAWFFLSLVIAGITRLGYPHYALIVIPSLSILAGWELARLSSLVPKSVKTWHIGLNQFGFGVIVLLTISNSIISNWQQYSHYFLYRTGIESYETFLEKGTLEGHIYTRNHLLMEYIVERTSPEDKIYYWSEFPQIYYLADRKAPIDMIWPIQAEVSGNQQKIFGPQTKYIILGNSFYIPNIPFWFQSELNKSYQLEAVIDEQEIYKRNEN